MYKQVSLDILPRASKTHSLLFSLSFSLSLSLEIFLSQSVKSYEIRRWTLCSRLLLFRLSSSPRRRLFWRWTRPPPPWPWPSSPPAWVLSRRHLRRRSSSIGPRRTFWTFPNHLWEGRRSCRQICLKRIEQKSARQSEYKRVKNTALKKKEIFFPLFSLLLRKSVCCFLSSSRAMVVDVSFFGAKTCSHFLDSWALVRYLSFTLSNYISRRERYHTLFTLSFRRKEGTKEAFTANGVCSREEWRSRSPSRARARTHSRFLEKMMTCAETRR